MATLKQLCQAIEISCALRSPFCQFSNSIYRAWLRESGVSSSEIKPEFLLVYQRTTLRRGRGGQTMLQPQHKASADAPWEPSLSEVQSEMLATL